MKAIRNILLGVLGLFILGSWAFVDTECTIPHADAGTFLPYYQMEHQLGINPAEECRRWFGDESRFAGWSYGAFGRFLSLTAQAIAYETHSNPK